ncbi:hypothetical protein K7X08_037455 [Anisodus acutangulus]|uniref:Uncharacterized protein n=1 Tax=Anisodus acutangulus TaxID=402998 RepID=A0A9Q1MXS9_9SOLA|nr:hypothetical protein K7X08_037455 [Anisodus acutangulus]
MVTVMIFFSSAAMAQDIAMAPTPPMETGLDTGNGFGLPVSEALELASAPAPAPDAGAAFGLAQSGAMVATSLLVSAVALLRH